MRICPKCKRRFPDNTLFCPDDGKALVERTGPTAPPAAQPAKPRPADASADDIDPMGATQSFEQVPGPGSKSQTPNRSPSPTPTRRESPPSMTPSNPQNQPPASSLSQPSAHDGASMDPSSLTGERLFGEYTIIRKLGEGGMGAVYLAKQDSIDQMIAVKVLHEDAAENNELIQRFHREAQVVSMLTHPNIIRVFIFGRTQNGLLYLAMEYVEGQTLRDLLDVGLLDEMRAIKIMKQLCSGLSEAHDLGIIHRDLKPDNVLLTNFRGEKDFAKILDFGIAKLKEPDGAQEQQKLTQAGIVYGTPEYLSPEQAQALELDHRTDLYSLACILFEFMTGRVPFQATTPVKILTAHVFNDPTPPTEVAPGRVSPTMERIILKGMAKKPEDRFQTAMEMFEALVAREQELVTEQGLSGRAGYVPGMELTGMYSAVEHMEEQASINEMPAPPETLDAQHPDLTSNTAPRQAQAMATSSQPKSQSKQSSNNSTRTVIYLLLAGTGMLFLVLMVTILILLVN